MARVLLLLKSLFPLGASEDGRSSRRRQLLVRNYIPVSLFWITNTCTTKNPKNPSQMSPMHASCWTIGDNYVLMATYKGVPTKISSLSSGFFSGNHRAGSGPYAKRLATNSTSCDVPFPCIVAT